MPSRAPDTAFLVEKPATKPFSIRLTEDEKRLLLIRAGRQPLGTYIRDLILVRDERAERRRMANPGMDQAVLARVLAALGQSGIAANLDELARSARIGALPIEPDTEETIRDACAAVLAIRGDLIAALGLGEGCPL